MKYMIVDLETTTSKYKGRTASSFHPDNYVVAYGWRVQGEEIEGIYIEEKTSVDDSGFYIPEDVTHLVGHNVTFDLLYIYSSETFRNFLKRGGKVWDTQLCEYILGNMQQKYHYNTLNDVSIRRGGDAKFDPVKEMWEAGIDTPDIPRDILMEYLLGSERAGLGDIGNTERVFLSQVSEAHERNCLHTLANRNEALLATTEFTYNGMYVDKEIGLTLAKDLQKSLDTINSTLDKELPEFPDELVFNWGSAYHTSALLFGGSIVYKKWLPALDVNSNRLYAQKIEKEVVTDGGIPVRYKSGKRAGELKYRNVKMDDLSKPKGKIHELLFECNGLTPAIPDFKSKREMRCGTPVYGTGKDVLDYLIAHRLGGDIPKLLGKRAKLDKDLGTYYIKYDAKKDKHTGLLTLVGEDGLVHGDINHTSTKTSRTSASNPNVQNFPRADTSECRNVFRSRWKYGKIGEADYSQLEVIGQAILTDDYQMKEDVINGVDFHCKRLSVKLGEDYDYIVEQCSIDGSAYKVERTHAKSFSFQRAFGAGVNSIAADTGMSVEEVEKLVAAEEILYPNVSAFYDGVEQAVNDTAKTLREIDPSRPYMHRPYQTGYWTAPTGTRFQWRQHTAPKYLQRKGIEMTFSPTERKNWPVQGVSGEIIQMALGKLNRAFIQKGWHSSNPDAEALMVNSVHDCVVFDAENDDKMQEVLRYAVRIMQDVPKFLLEVFNWKVEVPFRCEAEYGDSWYNVHHFNTGELAPFSREWLLEQEI